jgi:tRNA (guanine37-N1)-methyltransferase
MTGPNRSHGRLAIAPSAAPRALGEEERLAEAWTARVVTLFPEAFPGPLGASLIGRALAQGLWALETVDLRRFGLGRHRKVDDAPAGGGPGLVMRADVVGPALTHARQGLPGAPMLYLSPRGRRLDQAMVRRLAAGPGAVILCGRFEGVDERALVAHGAVEVSLGDFVMTGGEIAAMALIDATVRLIGGVLGNEASVEEESFSQGLLEHPHYTKPASWEGMETPDVLLSGDHAAVARWRRAEAERLTKERRPDLWRAAVKTELDPAEGPERSGDAKE